MKKFGSTPIFSQKLLAICVLSAMHSTFGFAQTNTTRETPTTVELESTTITIKKKKTNQNPAQISKTAEELSEQMVADTRDLVRHETGVSVVETGRFGASGYAIRGVDENRVAINIDGLRQAETLASQGFKELFEGYGNFNTARNSVEIETLKRATIKKGADSVVAGNGALGGAVLFDTKKPEEYLNEKDWHVGYKMGYATANNQKFGSLTLASRLGQLETLLVATRRDGHELENYDHKAYDDLLQGRERERVDPYHIKQNNTLLKLNYTINDNHRFGVGIDDTKRLSRGHDFSYTLRASRVVNYEEDKLRHTSDESNRRAISFFYTNTTPNPFWDEATIKFAKQDITAKARTDDFCDASKCADVANPLGLHLKEGKIVDKNGNAPFLSEQNGEIGVMANGQFYTQGYKLQRPDQYWFDCDVFDCNSPLAINVLERYPTKISLKEVVLDRVYQDPNTNKKYATVASGSYKDSIIIPNNSGYKENLYSDRDLNTNTKQVNLDFNKLAQWGSVSHKMTYGVMYNTTSKSMVNRSGSNAKDRQWWATSFLGMPSFGADKDKPYTCQTVTTSEKWNSALCPRENTYSFLIPVKIKEGAVYFSNATQLTDRLSVDIGYRYNKTKYQPNYVEGVSPKIPDDMVAGLFVPFPDPIGDAPRYWNYSGGFSDPQYQADLKNYNERKAAYDQAKANNPAQNIAYFSKAKTHSEHAFSVASAFDVLDTVRVQAKYAKGFRMPTIDEMYFTFKHPDITVFPNVDLNPEIAKSKELALTWHGKYGFITGNVFRTDYSNFIDFVFLRSQGLNNSNGGSASSRNYPLYQSVNRQTATVDGFEISSNLQVGSLLPRLDGVNISYKYTHQTGRADGDIPMNAVQPHTSVIGIGYDSQNRNFGTDLYITHVASKKAKDTYNLFWREQGATDTTMKWRSEGYTVLDLVAYVKPTKNITLQAGVYNLTDRKYLSWESARSIRDFGTSNMINRETGKGINRFYAPERNFKLSAEFVF